MSKGIVQVAVAPIRFEPSDKAEMTSQLLFGELVEITQKKEQWIKIKATYDNYEGWTDEKLIIPISEQQFNELSNSVQFVASPFDYAILDNIPFPLTIGAELRTKNSELLYSNKKFLFEGDRINPDFSIEKLLNLAFSYLNTPYLWGGKSTFGIDCSGFTQMCHKMCGIFLPRDAYQQAEVGEVLSFLEEAKPGDLAFFENNEGKIIHVGMVLKDLKIIHAHGKVRIDYLDHTGIFNTELKKYTHHLRFVRNVLK